jgi:hypothetical protein
MGCMAKIPFVSLRENAREGRQTHIKEHCYWATDIEPVLKLNNCWNIVSGDERELWFFHPQWGVGLSYLIFSETAEIPPPSSNFPAFKSILCGDVA